MRIPLLSRFCNAVLGFWRGIQCVLQAIMRGATLADAGGVKGRRCPATLAWWRLSGTSHSPSCALFGFWSRRLVAPLLLFMVQLFTLACGLTDFVLFLLIVFVAALRGVCDFAGGFGGRGFAAT